MSEHEKTVSSNWAWFTDYAFVYSKWTVNCEPGRRCEVGMGLSFGGKPRGQKIKFTTQKEFVTVGAGAIKVRVIDGKGPCRVRIDQGSRGLIPVHSLGGLRGLSND